MATRTLSVLIMRALTKSGAATIPDEAIWQMFVNGPAGSPSLLEYWTEVTDGYLRFANTVMWPWVTLSDPKAGADRQTQWSDAVAAYVALPEGNLTQTEVDSFDARILLCTPAVGYDAGGVGEARYCVLNPNAVFSFYLHEFGHVLGFRHSIGLPNDGDGSPGHPWYGDPFDIMSGLNFASLLGNPGSTHYIGRPTFSTDATITGWPINQNDLANDCKTVQGPEPARAHVHFFDPAACPAGTVREYWLPPTGLQAPIRATLSGAALHSLTGCLASLSFIHQANPPRAKAACTSSTSTRLVGTEAFTLLTPEVTRRTVRSSRGRQL